MRREIDEAADPRPNVGDDQGMTQGMTKTNTTDSDIRVDADDLTALRDSAAGLKPARTMLARSTLAGAHGSRFRGRGMDYRESRHYQAGDDIRNMDWRVTARSGHPHVKVFDEERERPVVIIADFGPSMFFASTGAFKSVVAARLAALIGWAAVGHGDRIGALIFDRDHQEIQPTGGRRGQMRLIRALVDAGDPDRGLSQVQIENPSRDQGVDQSHAASGELTRALARLRRVARPGSLVFLLSDFYSLDDDSERHLARLASHNDLTAFQIVDPLEVAPPPSGRYRISDGRHSGLIDTANGGQRSRYSTHFARHHARVRAVTERNGIPLLRCGTGDDPAERIAAAMAPRGRGAGIGLVGGSDLGRAGVDRPRPGGTDAEAV
ncbi:MAG: DUF58 domain-containing protein [Thiohalocapsa sp.]